MRFRLSATNANYKIEPESLTAGSIREKCDPPAITTFPERHQRFPLTTTLRGTVISKLQLTVDLRFRRIGRAFVAAIVVRPPQRFTPFTDRQGKIPVRESFLSYSREDYQFFAEPLSLLWRGFSAAGAPIARILPGPWKAMFHREFSDRARSPCRPFRFPKWKPREAASVVFVFRGRRGFLSQNAWPRSPFFSHLVPPTFRELQPV